MRLTPRHLVRPAVLAATLTAPLAVLALALPAQAEPIETEPRLEAPIETEPRTADAPIETEPRLEAPIETEPR